MIPAFTEHILSISFPLFLELHVNTHHLAFTEYPALLIWAWSLLIYFHYGMRMKVRLDGIRED